MGDADIVCFNIAVFICGLFILEKAADRFIDHTAKIAARLLVPSTLIALLTAGAEWEELVVVVAAIIQHESPLAMGNILGSSISNVLGAFSLGLIFSLTDVCFDRSSKIYTAILLTLTSLFAAYILLFKTWGRIGGGLLVLVFLVYIASIMLAIYKGVVTPPEDDNDSDSDDDLDSDSGSDAYTATKSEKAPHRHKRSRSNSSISLQDLEAAQSTSPETAPLTQEALSSLDLKERQLQFSKNPSKIQRSTIYHVCCLTFAVLTLSLSGYILSHSIITLSDAFSISNSLLGVTLLSFATTLPEKIVAVFSGSRSQSGVLVANSAGSNIFLLTLCAGVLFLAGDLQSLQVNGVTTFEVLWMWGSSVLFFATVMIGGKRWMGWGLLGLYLVFIVCEFSLERR